MQTSIRSSFLYILSAMLFGACGSAGLVDELDLGGDNGVGSSELNRSEREAAASDLSVKNDRVDEQTEAENAQQAEEAKKEEGRHQLSPEEQEAMRDERQRALEEDANTAIPSLEASIDADEVLCEEMSVMQADMETIKEALDDRGHSYDVDGIADCIALLAVTITRDIELLDNPEKIQELFFEADLIDAAADLSDQTICTDMTAFFCEE